jgi:hypothetical protein
MLEYGGLMGPFIGETTIRDEEAAARQLEAARAAFPGYDLIETWDGYAAVPAGTQVIRAITVDGLVAKLRQQ